MVQAWAWPGLGAGFVLAALAVAAYLLGYPAGNPAGYPIGCPVGYPADYPAGYLILSRPCPRLVIRKRRIPRVRTTKTQFLEEQ